MPGSNFDFKANWMLYCATIDSNFALSSFSVSNRSVWVSLIIDGPVEYYQKWKMVLFSADD